MAAAVGVARYESMAALNKNASASKEFGHRRITGKIKP